MTQGRRMKRYLYIPGAVLVGVFLFLVFSFSTPCACTDADQDLAYYVGMDDPSELSADVVEEGFREQFPKGQTFDQKKLLGLDDSSEKFYRGKGTYVCNYWIYKSVFAKTGYRVVFSLDGEGKVVGIEANDISCWFGFEFSYEG